MPRAILIHGAWQGAWSWDRLSPLLHRAGIGTTALDLPGNGVDATPPAAACLRLYVEHVLRHLTEPAFLIAHSGGGVVASAVAEARPEAVAGIAYVAGMMLPSGMGFADLIAEVLPHDPTVAGIGPYLEWSPDRLVSRVPPEAAIAFFLHDCPPADAIDSVRRLSGQGEAGRALKAELTADRFGKVPRLYIEATGDRSVVPSLQRRMQALVPGARRVGMPTGHVPMLAAPALLADALLGFIGGDSGT